MFQNSHKDKILKVLMIFTEAQQTLSLVIVAIISSLKALPQLILKRNPQMEMHQTIPHLFKEDIYLFQNI